MTEVWALARPEDIENRKPRPEEIFCACRCVASRPKKKKKGSTTIDGKSADRMIPSIANYWRCEQTAMPLIWFAARLAGQRLTRTAPPGLAVVCQFR